MGVVARIAVVLAKRANVAQGLDLSIYCCWSNSS
jgi:hypothetical protein